MPSSRPLPLSIWPLDASTAWPYRSDVRLQCLPEDMPADAWHFLWGSAAERLAQLREGDAGGELAARGLAIGTPQKAPATGQIKKLAIIGTAGRGDDGKKLNASSVSAMQEKALEVIDMIDRSGGNIDTLVSGGAAYGDHIAVQLYLAGEIPNLELHLPAPFENGRFRDNGTKDVSTNPGGTANFYHRLFREKTGIDGLKEIEAAIAKGARVTVSEGMFARNEIVALEADACFAMTFGNGPRVNDGGTADTMGMYLAVGGKSAHHFDLEHGTLHHSASVDPRFLKLPKRAIRKEAIKDQSPSPRVQMETMRHLPPAFLSLSSWGRIVRNRDYVVWVPPIEEFAKLVRGEAVALPAGLESIPKDQLRIGVPSQEMPCSEGFSALRGSPSQRMETMLRFARLRGEGEKLTLRIDGGTEVPATQLSEQLMRWRNDMVHPADVARPLAEADVRPSGEVKIGALLADRPGLIPLDGWTQFAPDLATRANAWKAALAALPPGAQVLDTYVAGEIDMGASLFGIRADATDADSIAASINDSLSFVSQVVRPGNQARIPKAPLHGVTTPVTVDPGLPMEEWDPRAFAWFMRQVMLSFPLRGPAAVGSIEFVAEKYLAQADAGRCYPAHRFLQSLAGSRDGTASPDEIAKVRARFGEWLTARLQRAAVDTLHTREIPGSRESLKQLRDPLVPNKAFLPENVLPAEPVGAVVTYHSWSKIEGDAKVAGRNVEGTARGTEGQAAVAVAQVGVPVEFPTEGEALHVGLVYTYQPPRVGILPDGTKGEKTSAGTLVEAITGRAYSHILEGKQPAAAEKEQPSTGLPIQDLCLTAYADSIVKRCGERSGTPLNDLPEISGDKAARLMRYLSHLQAVANCGWAGNAPSTSLVVEVKRGELAPAGLVNALGKYVHLPEASSSRRRNATADLAAAMKPTSGAQSEAGRPEVINLKTDPAALSRKGVVYAGRPGPKTPDAPFGNPFTRIPGIPGTIKVVDDAEAVSRFRSWLAGDSDRDFAQAHRAEILANLDKIRSATGVACFCHPGPCHVPILIDAAFGKNLEKPVATRVPAASASGRREIAADLVLDAMRATAAITYKSLTDERTNGRFLLLPVDTGNPLLLNRTPYLYPSTPAATAEVNGWFRKAEVFLSLVEPDAAPLRARSAQALAPIAGGPPTSSVLNDIGQQLAAAVAEIEATDRKEPASPPSLATVMPIEALYEAHVGLHLNSLNPEGQAPVSGDVVHALADALAALPRNAVVNIPADAEHGSFATLVAEAIAWKNPADVVRGLQLIYGIDTGPEARQVLDQAFSRREAAGQRDKLVANTHRALNRLDWMVSGIREEYPLADHVARDLLRVDPRRIATARTQLSVDDARSDTFAAGLKTLAGIASAAVSLGKNPAELTEHLKRAAALERIQVEAVANLTAQAQLTVPLVCAAKEGGGLLVGGFGGAYLKMLDSLGLQLTGPDKQPITVEFDRAGVLQEQAMNRWASKQAVVIGREGIQDPDDREQLSNLPQTRHLPDGVSPVCHVVPRREYELSRARFTERTAEPERGRGDVVIAEEHQNPFPGLER